MQIKTSSALLAATAAVTSATSLSSLCTAANVKASLPSITGFTYGNVTAATVYNTSVAAADNYPAISGRNFCNVSVNYAHTDKDDSINVYYYLPEPSQWSGRFLATGGFAYAINEGFTALDAGLVYNMAAGLTDGGFGGLSVELTDILVTQNGTFNWDSLINIAYLSIHEMTEVGSGLTANFYSNTSKIFTYYQACSEGGREGWSQIQRYGSQYDGVVVGAPAFRQAFQQPNHIWPQVQQTVAGYVPNTCALQKIINDTIAACDGLDGKVDGVVGRSDLCLLEYNTTASIGSAYYCAASDSSTSAATDGASGGTGTTPAENGTVNAKDVVAWNALIDGPFDSKGRQMYIGYQPGAEATSDVAGSYNSTSGTYYASGSGLGAQWVDMFLNEVDSEELSLEGVTADTIRGWMLEGMQKYAQTLQTVWTDLSEFQHSGGKVIHYHGEADASVPTISSVIYHDQVRKIMYPELSYADGVAAVGDFYKLFLVPGAAHCAPDAENGPWPQTMLASLIDWVENEVAPDQYLNATILQGKYEGQEQKICAWPTRPSWANVTEAATPVCEWPSDEALAKWYPVLDSIPLEVYGNA